MNYNFYLFYTLLILGYIAYFASIVNFIQLSNYKQYNTYLQIIIQLYIGLYLFIRFNPFNKIKFSDLDKVIIFNAGILLLTTSILNFYIDNYKNTIKKMLNIS